MVPALSGDNGQVAKGFAGYESFFEMKASVGLSGLLYFLNKKYKNYICPETGIVSSVFVLPVFSVGDAGAYVPKKISTECLEQLEDSFGAVFLKDTFTVGQLCVLSHTEWHDLAASLATRGDCDFPVVLDTGFSSVRFIVGLAKGYDPTVEGALDAASYAVARHAINGWLAQANASSASSYLAGESLIAGPENLFIAHEVASHLCTVLRGSHELCNQFDPDFLATDIEIQFKDDVAVLKIAVYDTLERKIVADWVMPAIANTPALLLEHLIRRYFASMYKGQVDWKLKPYISLGNSKRHFEQVYM